MRLSSNELLKAVRYSLYAGASVVVGLSAAPVFAQSEGQSGEKLETIVVTGSRIRSADVETAQPILVIDRAQIQNAGVVTVDDILQRMAESGGNNLGRGVNNGNDGQVTISLRNLGSARTLVLVNGRRWVSQLGGDVDLTTIPASVIERIEVLKDGASAIYGSDAIGGVINIITRDRFEGMEASAYYGQYQQGDGTTQSYDFTLGTTTDRASVVFNVGYVKAESVMAGDRDISSEPAYRFPGVGYSGTTNYGLVDRPAALGGGRFGINPGGFSGNFADYHPRTVPADTYNFAPDNYLLTPSERRSLFVQGRYDITDHIRFRTDVLYNERNSDQLLAAIPLGIGSRCSTTFSCSYSISPDSYYNPFPGYAVGGSRRFVESGGRAYQQEVKTFHFSAGLEGDFELVGRTFNWDVGFQRNQTDWLQTTAGQLNQLNIRTAVGPSFYDPSTGTVRCGTAANPIDGCVPLNFLGATGQITQEMLNYISYLDKESQRNKSEDYTANLTGDLFELPAGPLSFAVGVERRKESGYDRPDAFTSAGFSTGNALLPTKGQYDLNEIYGELQVPVLKDVPLAKELQLNVAVRYSDYSNFGNTTNAKFGLKWKPIDELLVRANYAEGFRAPNISELYGGISDDFAKFNDPCDRAQGAAGSSARCAADTPAGYTQPNGYGSQTARPFKSGSNPNLTPELATTKTLGLVYSPQFVDGLDLSLDWYKIKLTNRVGTAGIQFLLNQCYLANNAYFCDFFQRNPQTGEIITAQEGKFNLGAVNAEGYDLTIAYRLPETPIGNFKASLDLNYLSKFDTQAQPGDPFSGNVGQYGNPYWRIRSNLNVDWSLGDFGATWRSRYYSSVREECSFEEVCNQIDHIDPVYGELPLNRVGAATYHDVQFRWSAPWQGTVSVGVNNLFDREPPVLYQAFANSYDYNYDVPGRFYYVSYRQKF